jgi:hypothetical protein
MSDSGANNFPRSKPQQRLRTGFSRWTQQLTTKEDGIHVHKVLGVLALCSFLWRVPQFGANDMGFATHAEWTLPTLFLHLCLNLSSFEFRIPAKRIRSDGGRMWPEYRLHSLVFVLRTLGCIAINWYEQRSQVHSEDQHHQLFRPNYTLNFYLVLASLAAADLSSHSVEHQSNSIRELKAPVAIKYYFSVMQFMATSVALFGDRRNSVYFYKVMVLQVTAFLLTLRRKNLVSHSLNVVLYGALLAGGLGIGLYEYVGRRSGGDVDALIMVGSMAALWRMGPWPSVLRNKYLIWTTMHCIVLQLVLRPVLEGDPSAFLTPMQVKLLSYSLFAGMVLYGFYKHVQAEKETKNT